MRKPCLLAIFSSLHQAGGLELGEHAVDGGQPDVLVPRQQFLVDILGGHVTQRALLEDLEDLHARQGHLQARLAHYLFLFHCLLLCPAWPGAGQMGWRRDAARSGIRYHVPPESTAGQPRTPMRKLLISVAIAATLAGCSSVNIDKDSWDVFGNVIPRALDKLPIVHRPLIIQGNLITQDNVNKLKPGMHKKQVQLVMGTALLQDLFHEQRWDYYYGIGIGKIELEKRLTLFFDENDRLTHVAGDYRPLPPIKGKGAPKEVETVISVPDWQAPAKTLFEQAMHTVGLSEEEAATAAQEQKIKKEEGNEEELESVEEAPDDTEESQDDPDIF